LHLSSLLIQMLPIRREKVDVDKLLKTQDEEARRKFGILPQHKLMAMRHPRKYFDSGDYALSKAGRTPQNFVGTAIPNPDNIPHASNLGNGHSNGQQIISISPTNSTSPVNKESGLANNENTNVPEEYSKVPEKQLSGSGEESEIVGEETSIPPTLSFENGLGNSHQTTFTSPTSPLNKGSGLAKNEHIIVPEERLPESGEELVTVDEKTEST